MTTNKLLAEILAAHGSLERWHGFNDVTAKVVSGGFLWGMKGIEMDDAPRTMTSTFRRQWTRTEPFGKPDWHMIFEPDRVVIETQMGQRIAEQKNPRETFTEHVWETPWTSVQLGYFNGYAMWTYFNLPFLLGEPDFNVRDIPSIIQDDTPLRGLRVQFPKTIHTHSVEQNLYFDEEGLLRRHDYEVDVAGKTRAAHLISDYVDIQGLKFATKRRAYLRNEDGTPRYDKMPVAIDLSEFELS